MELHLKSREPREVCLKFFEMISDLPRGQQASLTVKIGESVQWSTPKVDIGSLAQSSNNQHPIVKQVLDAFGRFPDLPVEINFNSTTKDSEYGIRILRAPSRVGFTIKIEKGMSPVSFLVIYEAITKHYELLGPEMAISESLPQFQQQQAALNDEAIRAMKATAASIAETLAKQAVENAKHLNEINSKSQDLLAQRERKLDEIHAKKLAEIEQRESEHAARVEEFNLLESRGVRRSLSDQFQEAIDDKFKVSRDTLWLRVPVHVACIAGMISGIALVTVFVMKVFQAEAFEPLLLLPVAGGTLLFGTTFVFYLRWCNQWFQQHAEYEFQKSRFAKDVIRASWIAELLFEAAGENNDGSVEVPEFLVEQFAKNLFDTPRTNQKHHPIDDLYRYARRFKKISVGAGTMSASAESND